MDVVVWRSQVDLGMERFDLIQLLLTRENMADWKLAKEEKIQWKNFHLAFNSLIHFIQ